MIYTFRTVPYLDELLKFDDEIFVFKSLKSDFENFKIKSLSKKPKHILGIGNTKKESQLESKAVNIFNKSKQIEKRGKEEYNLFTFESVFSVNNRYTTSFCNWTTYKISSFIEEKKIDTKVSFLHLNKSDFNNLKETTILQKFY